LVYFPVVHGLGAIELKAFRYLLVNTPP